MDNDSFPFMQVRKIRVAGVKNVIVIRVSFTGECGYELYCPQGQQTKLFDAIVEAGKSENLGLVGTRALMMTRLEKSFPAWGTELSPDYNPYEAGVGEFVCLEKGEFIGCAAAQKLISTPQKEKRVTLTVAAGDCAVWGDEPVYKDNELVGYVTSGGYGAWSKQHIALAYLKSEAIEDKTNYQVELLGEMKSAKLLTEPLYDPKGLKMRE